MIHTILETKVYEIENDDWKESIILLIVTREEQEKGLADSGCDK